MSLEIVQSKNVLEMLTVANEFCLFTESAESKSIDDIIYYYQRICPLLYLKGLLLPETTVNENSVAERFVTEEQWETIYNQFKTKLKNKDIFYYNEDPLIENEKLQKASVSECIADIYQGMKDFVLLYQKNLLSAKEHAISDCRRLFYTHWGNRTLLIIEVLHAQQSENFKEDIE